MLTISHWGLIFAPPSWDYMGWMWDENPMEFGLDRRLHQSDAKLYHYL